MAAGDSSDRLSQLVERVEHGEDIVISWCRTARYGPGRDKLGMAPGDEVDFALEEDAVRVEPMRHRRGRRGQFVGLGLTAALGADRRAERGR